MRSRRLLLIALVALAVVATAGAAVRTVQVHRLEARLLTRPADDVPADAALVAFAVGRGPALYAANCARCHGEKLEGNTSVGAPNLADAVWLFGSGLPADIENTLLYGIRSGHPKAHNITDMPAFLRTGQLSRDEVADVVEYVLAISHQPHDAERATRGADLYGNKGNCFDCHSVDALGNPDYGAPALLGPTWLYGGSREALIHSVTEGRHGICPAWINTLSPAAVRELAIYLYDMSKRAGAKPERLE